MLNTQVRISGGSSMGSPSLLCMRVNTTSLSTGEDGSGNGSEDGSEDGSGNNEGAGLIKVKNNLIILIIYFILIN